MKKHVFLISLFLLFLGMTSCSSGNDGPVPTPTPQPTPTPVPSDKIDVTSKPSAAIQTAGGDATIEFTASTDWSASTSADWISISPTSGTAGSAKITVKVAENTTYDERNGAVTIKSGTASQNITITQKQKDAITLTSNKVEVNAEAGEATIEVKANVDYTFEIEESAKSWISVVQTRGLSASTIRLNIAENDNLNGREGKVTITSGDLSEIVTIYQAGAKATIVISQKEYTVSSNGEDVKVELQSNCDYEIRMPNVDWISKAETRAVSTYTHYFNVAENKTYDQREASIVFVNKENNIEESVKIKQVQKDAIIVAKNEYEVEYGACNLDFDVNSNVDFKVETSVDWISQATTRALTAKPLYFNIAENKTENKREGTITVSYQDIKQVIKVTQNRKSYLEIEQTSYEVAAESSVLDIAINTNSKYSVSVDSDWITEKSSTTGKHSFNIAENKAYDSRTAKIQFVNEETKDVINVTVKQKQVDAMILSKTEFDFDEEGGNLEVILSSNIESEMTIDCDWISQVTTRALTDTKYNFTVSANKGETKRTGKITFTNKTLGLSETVTVTQEAGFYLTKNTASILIGDYMQLELTGSTIGKTFKWESSDTSVATVDSNGKVTAKAKGESTITVSAAGKSQTCTVIVKDITGFISAYCSGGVISSINGKIQYGSRINWSISNSSTKDIVVKSLQLIDGQTGTKGNVMSVNYALNAGNTTGWSVTIGILGIYNPICRFVYVYNGKQYFIETQYEGGHRNSGEVPDSELILNVSKAAETIDANGGTFSVEVTSNVDYTIDIPVDWITCNKSSAQGNQTLIFTVSKNTGNKRDAEVKISGEGKSASIVVTQKAANQNSIDNGNGIVVP